MIKIIVNYESVCINQNKDGGKLVYSTVKAGRCPIMNQIIITKFPGSFFFPQLALYEMGGVRQCSFGVRRCSF